MFTLESALNEIYEFVIKFFRTFLYSLVKCRSIIQALKIGDDKNLINSKVYIMLCFFLFYPILSSFSLSSTVETDLTNALSDGLRNFYINYSLIEKLLIISPEIILSETILYILSRGLSSDKTVRNMFSKLYRYFTGSLLLVFSIALLLVEITSFIQTRFDFNAYLKMFDVIDITETIILLIAILALVITWTIAIARTGLSVENTKWLVLPFGTLVFSILLGISFQRVYAYYNLNLNTSKVYLSSIRDRNTLSLEFPDSTAAHEFPVTCDVLLKNNGNRESIIDLVSFNLDISYYTNPSSVMDDGTSITLRPAKKYLKEGNAIIIKPAEAIVLQFEAVMNQTQFKFFGDHHFAKNYWVDCYFSPYYADHFNEVKQLMTVDFGD